MKAGAYTLDFTKKTYVMGILNTTPDSFSDGGRFNTVDAAVAHAKQMAEDGADIIDIGGESTRPGYTPVSVEEEIERVVPVIEAVRREVDLPISIDTFKAQTAEAAVKAGAQIINDIWGAKYDPAIADVAAKHNVPIILMHNREKRDYEHFLTDVMRDLEESISIAKSAGVTDEQIILDPGVGFAKSFEQNVEVTREVDRIVAMGYPVLLGTSRKSMIGNILDLPAAERTEGTGATVCYGVQKGCHIVRVHDVKEIVRMTRVMDALIGKGE
ncbi:dihydropteroate synthase [Jeotgalibacillus haloalkalitolerans]|uniref:Dihydropteroate synthase n=1 Tax=Jeotgalibacillus haloalkalitolerans TaxID=3104292 RepID=A0ABU5KS91_9BACL|nr:dihydropteroate synthase [Jeotgalibacillus sp. HH7-29]MDZ5713816.1 dihydropteroate synthase [Jeotgalibacillus sp. HH7-29]